MVPGPPPTCFAKSFQDFFVGFNGEQRAARKLPEHLVPALLLEILPEFNGVPPIRLGGQPYRSAMLCLAHALSVTRRYAAFLFFVIRLSPYKSLSALLS